MPGYEYQRYFAEVANNQDPEFRGRIAVKSFDFTGDDEAVLLDYSAGDWVEPALDWGWFYVPDVGELVEIEILANTPGDIIPYQSLISNPKICWRGKRFPGDEGDSQVGARPIPDEFKSNYKRRGFYTPLGHIFYFDDTEGDSKISLSWKEKNKVQTLLLDKDGIKILVDGTNTLHLKVGELELKLSDGASWKVTGKDADAVGLLGNAAVKVAIADTLQSFYSTAATGVKAIFDAHIHPTGMGPSGQPTTQFPAWNSAINSNHLKIPNG